LPSLPDYELLEKIGQGGMGAVYKARHKRLGRTVAIKVIPAEHLDKQSSLDRFFAEARTVANVRHPNIVEVFDYQEVNGMPCLVMEYLGNGSLAVRLKAAAVVDLGETLRVLRQVAAAMAAVHAKGVVHRDLKPDNILFSDGGDAKVTDFGLAKRDDVDLTQTNIALGTPYYMSPEQANGQAKHAGPQSDVWSFGVIMYECLTRQHPFESDSRQELFKKIFFDEPTPLKVLNEEVPADLATVVAKCLQKKPEDRYPSAAELSQDLQRVRVEPKPDPKPAAKSEYKTPSALFADHPLTDLDRKAHALLGEKVVIKSLAASSAFHRLPRYVSEYLIAKYVKPDTWKADLANIQTKIKDLLPDLEHRELLKEKLLSRGEVALIDNVEVRIDLRGGQRWARVPALADNNVRVPATITEQHPGLLLGGLWGTVKVKYSPETDAAAPNELAAFTPFQVGPPDVAAFKAARGRFTTDEWCGLVLQSAGYAANAFPNRRTRLLLFARMVPLVERNVNLIELGPRQTGKTFLLRNLSPRVFTVSGGKTTPANLFVNLSTRQIGILGTRKVVVFDEIAHTTFGQGDDTLSTLKDYMESGHFSRGSLGFASDAGLVFAGNLDVEGDRPHPKYAHLLEPLPEAIIDSAFHDRMHGYVPGWEVPKIAPGSVATGVGFVTDYFGEVLVRLREETFGDAVRAVPMHAGLTRRDQTAVERLASGLLKLVHPDGNWTPDELLEIVTFASELRQRVHQQLCALAPGEFKSKLIAPSAVAAHEAEDLRPRTGARAADRLNTDAVVGAVTGLAVLTSGDREYGGDTILIQVSAINGGSGVTVTGLHGRVLKDSIQAVYNLIRANCRELNIPEQRLKTQALAVHLVKIAEPKDGPSAGLAFLVGMVSALTNRPIRPGMAFSVEVALHGEVGPVGGLPHKVAAAAKAGRTVVVIPAANAGVIDQLPEDLRAAVEVRPVATASEALALALT
jgi:ATP-dependent Lon protease